MPLVAPVGKVVFTSRHKRPLSCVFCFHEASVIVWAYGVKLAAVPHILLIIVVCDLALCQARRGSTVSLSQVLLAEVRPPKHLGFVLEQFVRLRCLTVEIHHWYVLVASLRQGHVRSA